MNNNLNNNTVADILIVDDIPAIGGALFFWSSDIELIL